MLTESMISNDARLTCNWTQRENEMRERVGGGGKVIKNKRGESQKINLTH